MHHLDEFTRVNLEKVAFLEVNGNVISFIFDNGKELSRTCESDEQALAILKEIDSALIPKPRERRPISAGPLK